MVGRAPPRRSVPPMRRVSTGGERLASNTSVINVRGWWSVTRTCQAGSMSECPPPTAGFLGNWLDFCRLRFTPATNLESMLHHQLRETNKRRDAYPDHSTPPQHKY